MISIQLEALIYSIMAIMVIIIIYICYLWCQINDYKLNYYDYYERYCKKSTECNTKEFIIDELRDAKVKLIAVLREGV